MSSVRVSILRVGFIHGHVLNTRVVCFLIAGRCHKECPGIVIDSLSTAQELRGCTHINGSLEIQIRGGSKCCVTNVITTRLIYCF